MQTFVVVETEVGVQSHFQVRDRSIIHEIDVLVLDGDTTMGALVALYGSKPAKLAQLISDCQAQITAVAGSAFQPYHVRQVHATIVGMGAAKSSKMTNACFYEYRDQQVEMDFDGLLDFLRSGGCLPFQIQIGGFQDRDYPFESHDARPYERSFALQDGKAVIIGWPIRGTPITYSSPNVIDLVHENRIYPNTLDEIRQAVQAFGFLHRYHRRLGDVDNDFYFRIGLYDPTVLPEPMQRAIERNIRQFLSDLEPVVVEITPSHLYLAFGSDETLSLDSTRVWQVSDRSVTAESIRHIYGY